MAQDIAEGTRFPIYFYGQSYMGALEAYVIALVAPLFRTPIMALRFVPACFFALLVFLQYLVLTRWFGRRGGLMGAGVLLAAAPMFAQWSISARGGYAEVLVWGTALLWAYSEWFVERTRHRVRRRNLFVFGLLLGSGLWINPLIVFFVVPILVHVLSDRPLARLLDTPKAGKWLRRLAIVTGRATLPLLAIVALLTLNMTWAVWAAPGEVRKVLLLDLVPQPVAAALLCAASLAALLIILLKTTWAGLARGMIRENGAMILGVFVGQLPAIAYAVQLALGWRSLDPSLPIGIRPLWLTGETMHFFIDGLPLLFGADPQRFLQLTRMGRHAVTLPLEPRMIQVLTVANWIVLVSVVTTFAAIIISQRRGLGRLLRLQPMHHTPAMMILFGIAGMVGLYILGGCSFDFQTIRYLVPIWVFVAGVFAAVMADRAIPSVVKLAPLCACLCWAFGQVATVKQLGNPHPLRALADTLIARGIDPAIADPLDAHLLSYLTRQQSRIVPFESDWPRLAHFRPLVEGDGPTDYVVQTQGVDRTRDWVIGRWPGQPPPETRRSLWPRMRAALCRDPDLLLLREPLVDGYERIRIRRPLIERKKP